MLLQLRRGHVRCKAARYNLCRKSSVSVLRMWACVVFRMSSLQGIMRPSSKPVCRCLHGAPLRTPTCSSQRSSRRCMLLQLRRGHVRCKAARYNLCRKSSVSVLRMWTCVVLRMSSLQGIMRLSSNRFAGVCMVHLSERPHVRRKGHRANVCSCNFGEVTSGVRRRDTTCAGSQACRSCVCGLAWFSGCPLCRELCVPPQNRFAGVCMVHLSERQHVRRKGHRADIHSAQSLSGSASTPWHSHPRHSRPQSESASVQKRKYHEYCARRNSPETAL